MTCITPARRKPRATWIAGAAWICALCSAGVQAAPTVAIVTSNATPTVGGAAFSYTITVINPDAVIANNLSLSLPLPTSVLLQNFSIGGTGAGSFSCTQPAVNSNGQVLCRALSLAAGASATFTPVVSIQPDTASGVRTATARLTVGSTVSTSSVQTSQQVDAPLSLSSSGPASAQIGSRISYLLSLNNGGSSTAINAFVTGVLPLGFSHFSAAGTSGLADVCDYQASNRTLTCALARLPTGSHKLTWTVEVAPTMPLGQAQVAFAITTPGTGSTAVGSSSVSTTITN